MSGVILRDYQKDALGKICNMENNIGLVMSSVASGKTILFSTIAAQSNGRVLIVVPSTELRDQTVDKLKMIDNTLDIGLVQATLDEIKSKIIVSTRQSLSHKKSTRIQRMLKHGNFEYLIFDEAHIAPYQIKKIINNINDNIKILAFSATPYTKECIDIFGKPIFIKTIYDLIMEDYLCEPKAIQVFSKTDLSDIKIVAGEFNQRQLEDAVNNEERNDLVVEAYKKYASDRKSTLVFASGISHSEDLASEFKKHGIYCKSIDSTLSNEERNKTLEEFKSGKLPVLINVSILTTGFDHPPTDCIILCRPTKSRILFEQILGRGLRISENKKDCLIIDVRDIITNHDLMDISSVFDMDIRSGETLKQASNRKKQEEELEEKVKQEEEQKRIEREKKRQEELELIAKQVKLFNKHMIKTFSENAYLDWFKVDNMTYCLSINPDYHLVIEQQEDDEFNLYGVVTKKDNKYTKHIDTMDNLLEIIRHGENIAFNRPTSFSDKNAEWKKAKMTEKQRVYCKFGTTKWDAHLYFIKNTIKWQINKYKKEIECNN